MPNYKIMKKFTITEIDLADDSDIISNSNCNIPKNDDKNIINLEKYQ